MAEMARHPSVRQIDSIAELRQIAPAWNRLWERSDVSLPTVRAELVAQWMERFSSRSFRVVLVEDGQSLLAALPLYERVRGCVVRVGDVSQNVWLPCGELLLERSADAAGVLELVVSGLESMRWPLLWFDLIPFETFRWREMVRTLTSRGFTVDLHPRFQIGQTAIAGSFDDYLAGRSRAHRQTVRKNLRRIERQGPVDWRVHTKFEPKEVEARLREAFEIEARSWKKGAGHTVLDTPGIFEFYLRQAEQLAAWGFLRLAFLEHRGQPIAFELGWTAKGVYHCFKVGYEPSHGRYGPGHLLRYKLLEWMHGEPGHVLVDYQGPLTEAVERWATGSYPIGRLVIAPPRAGSRALLRGYRAAASVVRFARAARQRVARGK